MARTRNSAHEPYLTEVANYFKFTMNLEIKRFPTLAPEQWADLTAILAVRSMLHRYSYFEGVSKLGPSSA